MTYIWEPEPDITVYELAVALGILIAALHNNVEPALEALPDEVRRHFTTVTNRE